MVEVAAILHLERSKFRTFCLFNDRCFFLSAVDSDYQPVGNDSLEGSYRYKTTICSPEISDLSAKCQHTRIDTAITEC